MADLHCPNCANRLPASAFAMTALKHKVEIAIDFSTTPENEEDVYAVDSEAKFSLTITCMNCIWWAELDLDIAAPDVHINLGEGNFELVKKVVLLLDGLNTSGLKLDYTTEYGKV